MAAGKLSIVIVFMVMAVAAIQLQTTKAQTTHVVGGALGWTVPSGANVYSTWASGQTFSVGDILVFNFTTGIHDVAEVTQAAFGPCTTANPISSVTTGPASITLTSAGTHYYICRVGSHCTLGQKVAVSASASTTATPAQAPAAPATPPPPAPGPASTPETTPAPAPTPSTAPTTSTPAPTPAMATPPSSPTSSPPSPTVANPPSPSTTPSAPTPAGSTTPPPPPASAASTLSAAAFPAAVLSIALAVLH